MLFRSKLSREGAKLAICTNKIEAHARALLAALGLDRFFPTITGRDTLGAYKPDPKHLTETIRLAGGLTDRAIMVGDSETDIKTAKAAKVPVIAVSFGYSTDPMASYGPDAIIDDFRELPRALATLEASRVNT